jgi:hypothetical protein
MGAAASTLTPETRSAIEALPAAARAELEGIAANHASASSEAPLACADPRWDAAGLFAWCAESAPLIRVGYLRGLASTNDVLEQAVPTAQLIRTIPPLSGTVEGVQLFAVLTGALMLPHPEPATELTALLGVLDNDRTRADDDDLVFWSHLCVSPGDPRARDGMYRLYTNYRVQTVVLTSAGPTTPSVFTRAETMAYLALSAFCQR